MSTSSGFDTHSSEHRYTEELQRKADAIRADLDRTLKALDERSSTKEVLERSLSHVRDNGGELVERFGALIRVTPCRCCSLRQV